MSDPDDLEKNSLKEKIVIVEYPSLKEAALTANILQNVSLNLQVVDSKRTWKNTDQQRFERTKEMCHKTPLFLHETGCGGRREWFNATLFFFTQIIVSTFTIRTNCKRQDNTNL